MIGGWSKAKEACACVPGRYATLDYAASGTACAVPPVTIEYKSIIGDLDDIGAETFSGLEWGEAKEGVSITTAEPFAMRDANGETGVRSKIRISYTSRGLDYLLRTRVLTSVVVDGTPDDSSVFTIGGVLETATTGDDGDVVIALEMEIPFPDDPGSGNSSTNQIIGPPESPAIVFLGTAARYTRRKRGFHRYSEDDLGKPVIYRTETLSGANPGCAVGGEPEVTYDQSQTITVSALVYEPGDGVIPADPTPSQADIDALQVLENDLSEVFIGGDPNALGSPEFPEFRDLAGGAISGGGTVETTNRSFGCLGETLVDVRTRTLTDVYATDDLRDELDAIVLAVAGDGFNGAPIGDFALAPFARKFLSPDETFYVVARSVVRPQVGEFIGYTWDPITVTVQWTRRTRDDLTSEILLEDESAEVVMDGPSIVGGSSDPFGLGVSFFAVTEGDAFTVAAAEGKSVDLINIRCAPVPEMQSAVRLEFAPEE